MDPANDGKPVLLHTQLDAAQGEAVLEWARQVLRDRETDQQAVLDCSEGAQGAPAAVSHDASQGLKYVLFFGENTLPASRSIVQRCVAVCAGATTRVYWKSSV
jgi:hypothetical protein